MPTEENTTTKPKAPANASPLSFGGGERGNTSANNIGTEPINSAEKIADEKNLTTPKTEEKTETKTAEINIHNAVKPGSKGFGFLESIKKQWQKHVEKNRAKAEARKKGEIATEKVAPESKKTSTNTTQKTTIDIEDFDPKIHKASQLTASQKKEILAQEKILHQGEIDLVDLVAPSSMEISTTGMKMGDQCIRSFYVYNYPRFLQSGWLNQIINFDARIDLSLFIYPTDPSRMIKVLRKKVAEMLSTKHINEKKGLVNDVSLDTALQDAQELRIKLQQGQEKFFQLGVYITVYAEDEEKLKTISKQIETILGGQLVMVRPADFQVERAFNTTLPQATDDIEVFRNMNTQPLSTAFPFLSSDLTSDRGILYGINRHNNSLIIFDRFQLENANSVIFAKSGAGKSYTIKLEILRSLMMGTDVIILDPENEYETLTQTVGGTYINISLNSRQRINPFDLPKPLSGEEYNTKDLLRENIITITGLLGLMLGKLTPVEEGIIDRALIQVYQVKGITENTENPYEYEMPTMNDLKKILTGIEGGQALATRLEKYTEGTFSGLFSDQTNVDLDSGLVCFCIRDLEDKLRPIAMYILLNFIWNRVRSELKKRILVVDEAWHLVQYEDSGRFLHNLVKRARKYYLGISTITQDVEDFMGASWGKPIITNSSMQILLRQAPSAMEVLQKTFNLTDQERLLLLNSDVGQGLFFAGNQHVAIQIIASYGEDKIITTNPEEILRQQEKNE